MYTKIIFAALLAFISVSGYSQSTQFRYRVRVKKKHLVMQTIKSLAGDTIPVKKYDIISSQKQFKIGEDSFTLERKDTAVADAYRVADKDSSARRILEGWASVAVDKDDPSKININYWRNPTNSFSTGTCFRITNSIKTVDTILKKDTRLSMTYVSVEDYNKFTKAQTDLGNIRNAINTSAAALNSTSTASDVKRLDSLNKKESAISNSISDLIWLSYTSEIWCKTQGVGGTPLAYYAKKYNENYYIKLANREYVSFHFNAIELGPLTIPFKFRPKTTRNGKDVDADMQADLNIGTYLGYSFGKVRYMYRKNEEKTPAKLIISAGPFFSIAKVELDSSSTHTAAVPLSKKMNTVSLTPGFGVMADVYNFRVGLFTGWDFTVGEKAKLWDYNGKIWFGLGVGYNIGLLWGSAK